MRFYITLFIVLTLLAIAFVFGSQNHQLFTLNYLIARSELSVAMAVSIFTSIGFIIGVLVTLMWRFSKKLRRNKSIKRNKVSS